MLGARAGPGTAATAAHIESCPRCQAWMAEARANDELFESLERVMDDVFGQAGTTLTHRPRPARLDGNDLPGDPTLELKGSGAEALTRASALTAGPSIEGYVVHEEIGRGGMGVVYRATQQSTKRTVAIKVLREGPFASRSAKRRFEREVELVAQLHHPHIVTILESGIATGRYYFAMAYIEGQPLDVYLAARGQAPVELLGWFCTICRAVNYAHQQGVIHRDLKPSNILVDADGNPHILDFGLAKVRDDTGSSEAERSLLSMEGQVMGTLPYMAPEQALGRMHDIDTRTDVYALGAILYEMLTGRYPHAVGGPVADVLQRIAHSDPDRPSTFSRAINDEIETIVLKALAREKDRRYASAEDLARDLERYVSGHPIEAKRDSGWYVFRKTVRRHRRRLAVAGVAAAVTVVALIAYAVQRERLDQSATRTIMTALVHEPATAMEQLAAANARVRRNLTQLAQVHLASPADTERVMGAASGFLVNEAAFWAAVDHGLLWERGEWLALCELPWPDPAAVAARLRPWAIRGTDRQKYVAFCLIGQLANRNREMAALCADAVRTEADAGVVAAAHWAARRLGPPVEFSDQGPLELDEHSGLVFARVPGAEAFRRGSDDDDRDRLDDEERPANGVSISPFHLSTTEVTRAAFEPFFATANERELFKAYATYPQMAAQFDAHVEGDASTIAVGWITRNMARRFCAWLGETAQKRGLSQRYRLPTEDEWEFACRAGHDTRFCFGDDAEYARFFARCNGQTVRFHTVGEYMPNAFGLFDMHGGLWEVCNTRYPERFVDEPTHMGKTLWVIRGGAYYSPAVRCRSAQRNYRDEQSAYHYSGFRVVMERLEP